MVDQEVGHHMILHLLSSVHGFFWHVLLFIDTEIKLPKLLLYIYIKEMKWDVLFLFSAAEKKDKKEDETMDTKWMTMETFF